MTVVIISTLTFVLSTMPELAEEIDVVLFDNETEATQDSVERWDQVSANQHSPTFTYHIRQQLSTRESLDFTCP